VVLAIVFTFQPTLKSNVYDDDDDDDDIGLPILHISQKCTVRPYVKYYGACIISFIRDFTKVCPGMKLL